MSLRSVLNENNIVLFWSLFIIAPIIHPLDNHYVDVWFSTMCSNNVNIHCELQSTQLSKGYAKHVAYSSGSIKLAWDRACFYVDQHWQPHVFLPKDFSSKPHKPERILDSETKRLRSKHIQEFKIKWMDGSIKDATWEREDALKSNFSHFFCKSAIF